MIIQNIKKQYQNNLQKSNNNDSIIKFNNKSIRPFSSSKNTTSAFGQTKASFFSSNKTISSSRSNRNHPNISLFTNKNQSKNHTQRQDQYKIYTQLVINGNIKIKTLQQAKKFQKQSPPLITFFNDKLRKQYNEALIDSYFLQQGNNPQQNLQQEERYSPIFSRSKNTGKNNPNFNLLNSYKNKNYYKRIVHTAEAKYRKVNQNKGYLSSAFRHSQTDNVNKSYHFQSFGNINANVNINNNNNKVTNQKIDKIKDFQQKDQKQQNNLPTIQEHDYIPLIKRPISQQKKTRRVNLSSNTIIPNQMLTFVNNSNLNNYNQFQTSSHGQISNLSRKSQDSDDYILDLQKQRENSQNQNQIKKLSISQISINKQFQNQYYQTFKIMNIDSNEATVSKIKKFKKSGKQIYDRQTKINKLKVIPFLWNQQQTQSKKLYATTFHKKSLRQQLYKMVQQKRGQQDIFTLYPKKEYSQLFLNKNQLLIDIINSIAKQFKSIQGKVVHPKININNVYRIREKELMIDDWGYSGVKQTLKIRDKQWSTCTPPLIGQQKEWLVIPEYLAPQIIHDYLNNWKTQQIWSSPSGTNIWSLGCLIFQILTLIPLWIPYRCFIKGQQQLKKGILSVKRRVPQQVSSKHKLFVSKAQRIVKKKCYALKYNINQKVIQVMTRCLKLNPKERITPQEIINFLKF